MKTNQQIIIVLLILALAFIIYDQGNEYLQEERQTYYNLGIQEGALQWSNQDLTIVNNQGIIPYWVYSNNTNQYIRQSIPIVNLCENFR